MMFRNKDPAMPAMVPKSTTYELKCDPMTDDETANRSTDDGAREVGATGTKNSPTVPFTFNDSAAPHMAA